MKKLLFYSLLALIPFGVTEVSAQNVLDGVYIKEHTPLRRVTPLCHLREADIIWSRRIWRVIDLREKINIPLAFPKHDDTKDRKSLIDLLYNAVKEGTLTPYDYVDDEFTKPITFEEFERFGGSRMDTTQIPIDPNNPDITIDTVIRQDFRFDDIVQYRIKEDVFFDKQRSVIETRIIGLAPLKYDRDDQGNIREGSKPIPVCWFYFPEARKVLSNNEVFNRQNDGERRTFDDVFMKRMFNSYIIKESNEYNRRIEDYKINPMDALLEADRIKMDIINLEHDMWEY